MLSTFLKIYDCLHSSLGGAFTERILTLACPGRCCSTLRPLVRQRCQAFQKGESLEIFSCDNWV